MKPIEKWISLSLINLSIVALLGLLLRSKALFSLPFIEYKYVLHAHSHFAFGGWVTLALLTLMRYQLLPARLSRKPAYTWLLAGVLINAAGMLISFCCQGYGFYSILFSTLFIFVSYGYGFIFIRDIISTGQPKDIKILATASMIYMIISSAGPFTLAYLLATKSSNLYLYKDSIYTYLHLQYSGFFTLAVFALLLGTVKVTDRHTIRFSWVLNISVIPSMFISYLWHYPNEVVKMVAVIGSLTLGICVISFFPMIRSVKAAAGALKPMTRKIGLVAMTAFMLKTIFQALTILPSLGTLVFANRPVIIGFLHLVLLGFISIYLLAHFIQTGILPGNKMMSISIWTFITGIVINETVLMSQGLGAMIMISNKAIPWLLWLAAICLFCGAVLITFSKLRGSAVFRPGIFNHLRMTKPFLNHKNINNEQRVY